MRLVLTYFVPEPPSLQRDGSVGVRRALICFVPEPPICILLIIVFVIFRVNNIAHDSHSKKITNNSVCNLSKYKSLPLMP